MYGYVNQFHDANNALRNEISFQNLIAVANNPVLFSALSEETKQKLIETIATYTEENLQAIEYYRSKNDSNHKWKEPQSSSRR